MPVMPQRSPEASPLGFHLPHDHTQLISEEAVERICAKIARLPPIRVADISSTYCGGGVSEILLPLTLLLKKEVQKGLQGKEVELTTQHDQALFDTSLSPDRGVQARSIPCV